MPKVLNDGYTLTSTIPAAKTNTGKEISKEFTVTYRPALPRQIAAYRQTRGTFDDQLKFILEHLISWTVTQKQLQPWDKALNEDLAKVDKEAFELLDLRQTEQMVDTICQWAGEQSEEAKN